MEVFHIGIVDNNRTWNYYDKAEQKKVNFITKLRKLLQNLLQTH
jgi:hypothetical protein